MRLMQAVKNVAIVSLSSGILGESFVRFEVEIGLRRLKDYLDAVMAAKKKYTDEIGCCADYAPTWLKNFVEKARKKYAERAHNGLLINY